MNGRLWKLAGIIVVISLTGIFLGLTMDAEASFLGKVVLALLVMLLFAFGMFALLIDAK